MFLHKKCRFCILSLKNIATIPLLQQLPETLKKTLTNGLSIYNYMLGSESINANNEGSDQPAHSQSDQHHRYLLSVKYNI